MPAPRVTETVIRNAIKAAQSCDIVVGEVRVEKDGTVRIIAAQPGNVIPMERGGAGPRRFGQTG